MDDAYSVEGLHRFTLARAKPLRLNPMRARLLGPGR